MADKENNDNGEKNISHDSMLLLLGYIGDGLEDKEIKNCKKNQGNKCYYQKINAYAIDRNVERMLS